MFPKRLQDDTNNSRRAEDSVCATAIQQNQELLGLLADTAPVMIWTAGCDKHYNYFNSAWLEFTGRSHQQEVGNGWMEAVHPEDRQQCQDIYLTSFERQQQFRRQYRLRRADGEYRWILDTAAPRFAVDGSLSGYIGYAVDITEIKVKKKSLIKSESKLQRALETAETGIWDWNFRTGRVSFSEQVEHLFGWKSNSLPTNYRAFLKCIHRSDRSIVTRAIRNTLQQRTNYDADFRIVLEDGAVRWLRSKGNVLRDRHGQAARMIGTLIDISERKLAELALQEAKKQLENQLQTEISQRQQAEAELHALFAAIGDVILVLDAQGHYLKIAPTNPTSSYKPPEDLIGKTLHDVFGRSQADFFLDKIQRAITNQETINFEYCLNIDNAEVWFAASVSPLLQDTVIWVARDITACKQAEQERNRFLQLPLEMLCIAGFDGYFKQLNPAWEETLGWTQEELTACPFIEFVHPDDQEATIAAAQKLATGNDVICFENRYRCKDGSYKWLLWTSRTVPQQQLIYAVARDVSDRKLAEQALRQNEAQYRRLIETAAEGICILDIEGKTSFANPKIAQMLGYTVEEMIGTPLFAFMDAQGQAIAAKHLEGRHQGIAEQHDFKFCRKDGSELWAMIATNPIFDDAGQYLGTLGMLTDITDRKRAEEALQKSEARNRAMLDAIPDLMFRSNREGVYLDYVAAKDAELAVPAHEIIGRSVYELLPPELAKKVIYYTEKAIERGNIQIFEYQLLIKDELRDYEARLVPSGEDEVLAIVRDITERKQNEEALQALVAGTAAVTGEEFFPALVRHLAAALGVRYALVAEKVDTEYTKARVLAFWAGDGLAENFEYELANTPCENVAKQGMAYYLFGVQQLFPLDRNLVTIQAESYLGASFIDSLGVAIGHIAVFDTKPLLEEERAKAILSIFAARATAELQRQRTEDALRQSERQFRELACKEALLNRLASQIRASLDISTILEIAVTEIHNLLQIDLCSFTWYRADVQPPHWEVFQEAKSIATPSLLDFRPTNEEIGIIAQKIFNKEIIRVDDVQAIADPISRQFFVSLGLTATLILPIHTQSGEIGTLSCNHFNGSRLWLDSEVELLLAVTDQIAIAIDQAQLYKQSRIAAQTAQEKAQQLEQTLQELQAMQAQLIQNEKMSSLGQLVAGIAHEINNPVNFIHGNITHASEYAQDLLRLVELYQQHYPNPEPEIEEEIEAIDLEFLCQDLPKLLTSMRIGTDRIRQIVLSLRNFSRLDEADMKAVDIHEGIDNTLLLLQNRLKAKPEHQEIQIVKEYGDLPLVNCYAGQLNQVFMNLLANAIDALEEGNRSWVIGNGEEIPNYQLPTIHIRTEIQDNFVFIRIADNGPGMTEEVQQKLFDPFFTTKAVGKGTGMGLSISYKIVVEKHKGIFKCISSPGKGAEFIVAIPLQ
ncbi:MAG: PAS domain S-box protein [Fischerella sp.]|nr:PAS domain S-box protein [Fischerella sp.]